MLEPALTERGQPPRRTGFATSDPTVARDFMDDAYGGRLRIEGWRERSWKLAVDQTATPQVASGNVRMPGDLTYQVDGHDELVIVTVLSGGVDYANHSFDERMGRGEICAGNHRALHCLCHTRALHASTISLPQSLLTAAAAEVSSGSPEAWKVTSIRPLPGSARRWRQATRFLDELLADPETSGAPLIIGPAARLLAATALAIFPNTAAGEDPASQRRDAHPDALRRAIAFIDASPDLDITLADVARGAGVTPRAVQLAFRRHLDTTPMAYLRRVRLDHAHQQLLDATPQDRLTVTRTAIDWGFANPSRFAAHYRIAFGEAPSVTLRR